MSGVSAQSPRTKTDGHGQMPETAKSVRPDGHGQMPIGMSSSVRAACEPDEKLIEALKHQFKSNSAVAEKHHASTRPPRAASLNTAEHRSGFGRELGPHRSLAISRTNAMQMAECLSAFDASARETTHLKGR